MRRAKRKPTIAMGWPGHSSAEERAIGEDVAGRVSGWRSHKRRPIAPDAARFGPKRQAAQDASCRCATPTRFRQSRWKWCGLWRKNVGATQRFLPVLAVSLLLFLSLVGCARQSENPATEADATDGRVARSEVERGPVRVRVTVEPAKARLSDEPTLTLSIDYQQGVTVRKPPFGQSLGDFLVRDFREPLPRIQGDREILEQIYRLEPTRTGKLAVWPISVTFVDSRPDGDGKEHRLETEGLTVEVESVLGSELPSLGALKPAAGPVELPPSGHASAWWAAAAIAAVAGLALAWWLYKRRRKKPAEKVLSPQEQARRELERLLEDRLAERDVKLFYVELTAIVRRYIERTTGIRAPEQTTEEFLREISLCDVFQLEESRRLRHFLEAADLVKFAAYEPRAEDLAESVQRAKAFLGLEPVEASA